MKDTMLQQSIASDIRSIKIYPKHTDMKIMQERMKKRNMERSNIGVYPMY